MEKHWKEKGMMILEMRKMKLELLKMVMRMVMRMGMRMVMVMNRKLKPLSKKKQNHIILRRIPAAGPDGWHPSPGGGACGP